MTIWRSGSTASALILASLAGACSLDNREDAWYNKTMVELASGSGSPQSSPQSSPGIATASGYPVAVRQEEPVRVAAVSDEFYRSDGSCGGMPLGSSPGGAPVSPLMNSAIAFDMTECDVVRRAGPPDKAEITMSERGERNLILTYSRVDRNNVYRFFAGRLVSIERGQPLPPPPPARPAPAKKRAGA